jgi:hypothetical protein
MVPLANRADLRRNVGRHVQTSGQLVALPHFRGHLQNTEAQLYSVVPRYAVFRLRGRGPRAHSGVRSQRLAKLRACLRRQVV